MLIREATSDDIPHMHRIRLSVRENRLNDTSWLTPDVYAACLKPAGTANTWVAEIDGTVAGFATARLAEGDIWALFVDSTHEGHGIGRALLDRAVGWLFERALGEVMLATGPGTRADAFYRRAGWRRGETLENGDVRYRLPRPAAH
jgi:GNAT superfamily N-acetyltransferase